MFHWDAPLRGQLTLVFVQRCSQSDNLLASENKRENKLLINLRRDVKLQEAIREILSSILLIIRRVSMTYGTHNKLEISTKKIP